MHRIKVFLGAAAGLLVAAMFVVWSGMYNVAATEPHFDVTEWLFARVRDNSIAIRADTITPPAGYRARLDKAHAVRSFQEMCVACHSAPGLDASVVREGLNPKPPRLSEERVQARTDAELFWIVSHGIKMTGMPAFGPTHDDADIWKLVAFIRELGDMDPEGYQALLAAAGVAQETAAGHAHDDGHEPRERTPRTQETADEERA